MGSKRRMSLKHIEAYSLNSEYRIAGSSHCFVITDDRKTCWENKGGGWYSKREKTKVAENDAYWEWLLKFVPPNDIDKCGITFGVNGLCHTYATRELLIGKNNVNVSNAPKNYVCVFFFGKYGMGLSELKQILTDSYQDTMVSCEDPYNALNNVLARVDDTVDFELAAWRKVAIEYAHVPVDKILAKNYSGGMAVARSRMRDFINKREDVYHREAERNIQVAIRDLIQAESDDYLSFLTRIGYITEDECANYSNNLRNFLKSVINYINAQREAYLQSGIVPDHIRLEDYIGE